MPGTPVRRPAVRARRGHLERGLRLGGDAGQDALLPGGDGPGAAHVYFHRARDARQ